MKAKNIFTTLAFAMLLTTACNKSEDAINNENNDQKGFAIPVTINVTRQGDDDAATKATYTDNGDGTGALSFSTGDQLFVSGMHLAIPNGAGSFAGTLTWVSGGKFSGTIITENEWTGTADELFTAANSSGSVIAVLLPAGYGTYGYWSITDSGTCSAYINPTPNSAIASSKATAVEQFSCEMADTYSSGFALSPQNAILNFTISGLAPSTEVTATLKFGSDLLFSDLVSGSVTTDGSGNASFVMAIGGGFYNINELTLTIGGNDITITSSDVSLVAGKIYNITRAANAINGKFSVSATKQVYFSKGNLRYASGTWSFFDTQYGRYETYSADAWDKFGWVGTTGTLTSGIEQWGASISTNEAGYGVSTTDKLKSDWGNVPGIGSGWRTLSGGDSGEWNYLLNTRSASTVNGTANARFAKGKVNGRYGVILFPDTYSHPEGVTHPVGINDPGNTGWNGNSYDVTAWAKMEAAGCVFLPVTGTRTGKIISNVDDGYYWSSTVYYDREGFAYGVRFGSDNWYAGTMTAGRYWGRSVRLVREVE